MKTWIDNNKHPTIVSFSPIIWWLSYYCFCAYYHQIIVPIWGLILYEFTKLILLNQPLDCLFELFSWLNGMTTTSMEVTVLLLILQVWFQWIWLLSRLFNTNGHQHIDTKCVEKCILLHQSTLTMLMWWSNKETMAPLLLILLLFLCLINTSLNILTLAYELLDSWWVLSKHCSGPYPVLVNKAHDKALQRRTLLAA